MRGLGSSSEEGVLGNATRRQHNMVVSNASNNTNTKPMLHRKLCGNVVRQPSSCFFCKPCCVGVRRSSDARPTDETTTRAIVRSNGPSRQYNDIPHLRGKYNARTMMLAGVACVYIGKRAGQPHFFHGAGLTPVLVCKRGYYNKHVVVCRTSSFCLSRSDNLKAWLASHRTFVTDTCHSMLAGSDISIRADCMIGVCKGHASELLNR